MTFKHLHNKYIDDKSNQTVNMIKLSIIIPVYNCIQYTTQVVTEIQQYTSNAYELIIVDNGSTDGTPAFLKDLKSQGKIELVVNESNLGFAHANNQGIEISRGEYVIFLNNDVLLHPGWDDLLLNTFKKSNIGAAGPITNNCAGDQCEKYQCKNVNPVDYLAKADQITKLNKGGVTILSNLVGFCLMVPRIILKHIKGFDEKFRTGNYEDNDLCVRIQLLGYELAVAEDCLIYHYGSKTFSGNNYKYNKILSKNAKYFQKKWGAVFSGAGYSIPDIKNKECNIVNENYLLMTGLEAEPESEEQFPFVAKIARLGKTIELYEANEHHKAFLECATCINDRPFHPEAYLQLVEIVLDKDDYKTAKTLASILLNMVPNWELARQLHAKLNQKFENNDIQWPNLSEHFRLQYFKNSIFQPEPLETYPRLTVCLIVKNEACNLPRCLLSIRSLAHEIIVLDTGSSDNSVDIARNYNCRVYTFVWNNDFSAARNKCLEYARGDWVLFLDADEELAPGASETIIEDMARPNILGYRLPLENVGSQLHGCNYVPRLVRNAPGLHFIGKIHETIHASVLVVMKQWNMEQVIGKTKILHHGYKPEALESKNKLQRNLELYEEALEELPDEPSIMMNYAHDLNHDGQKERAQQIYEDILKIFEQHKKEHITPEVREQFIHNYGVFLAQHLKMRELSEVMNSRTARETGPVANVHYMAGLGLMNCNKFREAIPELEASMEKAYDDTLAPCVPDVRTWKPKHLLANCHASVGNELKAIRLWEEVISECDDSPDPFHDYARFLSTLERNKEALEILLKGLKVQGDTRKIWELGCGVVNKDPELAEMSLEWTEEALKHHPDSDVTNVRRGESLMKNGRFAEATEYFTRLSDRGEKTATAAQLVCRQLSNQADKHDSEIARGFVNEVTGWIDVLDKAPCAFDRELAEQLIR